MCRLRLGPKAETDDTKFLSVSSVSVPLYDPSLALIPRLLADRIRSLRTFTRLSSRSATWNRWPAKLISQTLWWAWTGYRRVFVLSKSNNFQEVRHMLPFNFVLSAHSITYLQMKVLGFSYFFRVFIMYYFVEHARKIAILCFA